MCWTQAQQLRRLHDMAAGRHRWTIRKVWWAARDLRHQQEILTAQVLLLYRTMGNYSAEANMLQFELVDSPWFHRRQNDMEMEHDRTG